MRSYIISTTHLSLVCSPLPSVLYSTLFIYLWNLVTIQNSVYGSISSSILEFY